MTLYKINYLFKSKRQNDAKWSGRTSMSADERSLLITSPRVVILYLYEIKVSLEANLKTNLKLTLETIAN